MFNRLTALLLTLTLLTACGTAAAPTTAEAPSAATPVPTATSAPTSTPAPSPTPTPEPSATPAPAEALATTPPGSVPTPTQAPDLPDRKSEPPKVYSWNPADYTYHRIGGNNRNSPAVGQELLGYKAVPDAKPEENPVELLGFLVLTSDGGKESYFLTPTQLYSKERGVLDASPQQCRVLHVMAKANNSSEKGNAQWLRYMSEEKLTEVKFYGNSLAGTTTDISFTTSDPKRMVSMAYALSNISVQPNSTTKFENGTGPNPSTSDEAMTIKLTFNTGVVYDVWIFEDNLYIFSSDMDYSLGYRSLSDAPRGNAENIYYLLHPEMELPPHLTPNPDT